MLDRASLSHLLRFLGGHDNLERTGDLSVEAACVVGDGRSEDALVFPQLNVFWYSPRVPAGATSPKRHLAAGDLFTGSIDNRDGGDH